MAMARVRFLHTADWQLGLHRHYLDQGAQELFAEARFGAIRKMGRLAAEAGCAFVVAAGDVFDANQVDRRTVGRALEALSTIPVPVYLLPGNHDPLEPGSVYASAGFRSRLPAHVHVLDTPDIQQVAPGVELVAAPWWSKRPVSDPVAEAYRDLGPASDLRVLVGHGAIDRLAAGTGDPALIRCRSLEDALAAGCLHYVALGDRHSATRVAERIWYAGTPEATDYDEDRPGRVLLVTLDGDRCEVEEHEVGSWRFVRLACELAGPEDLEQVQEKLRALPDKERTVVKLGLTGTLPVRAKAELDQFLAEEGDLLAAVEWWEHGSDLAVVPDEEDAQTLGLSGFARQAWERLSQETRRGGAEGQRAADALALLYRLGGDDR